MNTEDIKYFFQEIRSQTLKDLERKRKVYLYTIKVGLISCFLFPICIVLLFAFGGFYYVEEKFDKKFFPFVKLIQSFLNTLSEWTSIPPFELALGIFILLLISLFLMFYSRAESRYINTFKNKINKKLFQRLNPYITYNSKKHISKEDFENSGLFPPNCDYDGNDHCSGTVEGRSLEFSEMKAYRTSSGEDSSTTVYFHGLFMKLSLPLSMEGIYIVPKKTDVRGFSSVLKTRKINSFKNKERLNSQTNFDQQFNVYCDNTSEAQLFLTDNIKNNILNIYTRFNKNIYVSVKDSHLYLGIECGAFFEPSVKSTVQMEDIQKSAEFFISFMDTVSSSLIPSFCKV